MDLQDSIQYLYKWIKKLQIVTEHQIACGRAKAKKKGNENFKLWHRLWTTRSVIVQKFHAHNLEENCICTYVTGSHCYPGSPELFHKFAWLTLLVPIIYSLVFTSSSIWSQHRIVQYECGSLLHCSARIREKIPLV